MSWYSIIDKLIKIAGPKEKIAQFGIKDPALIMFISKYESKIAWNGYSVDMVNAAGEEVQVDKKIRPTSAYAKANPPRTGEDDINEFLVLKVLPTVFAKTDPKSSNNNYSRYLNIAKVYKEAKEKGIFNPDLDKANNIDMLVADQIKKGKKVEEIIKNPLLQDNKITEDDINNHMQKIQQEQELEQNPQAVQQKKFRTAGERFYLGIINGIKKHTFDGWTNYLKGHPDYSKHPAFVYLLLNDVLDSSDAKTHNPPPSANPAVVAGIFHKVQGLKPIVNEQFNKEVLALVKQNIAPQEIANQLKAPIEQITEVINQDKIRSSSLLKMYKEDLVEHSLKVSKHEIQNENGDRWLKLPSKAKTQPKINEKGEELTADQVFEENLKVLDNFSVPNSWCTTLAWNGRPYLTAGDFWLFIQKGKAEVGIRFDGDTIQEIAGDQTPTRGHDYVCPTRFWKEITALIYNEGLENKIVGYQAKHHWEKILKEKNLNVSFFNPDGSPNMEEVEAFKTELMNKPELFSRVQNEQFAKYPELVEELKEICKQGWFKKIQALHGRDALALAENVAANAQNMPDFVLADPAFLENVHGRLTAMYENNPESIQGVLDRVPNHWQVYPQGKEVFKKAVLKKYATGMSWKANAYGATRKTKEQRRAIDLAKIELQKLEEAVGRYMPELNDDQAFQADLEIVKQESAETALSEGYFSPDMNKEAVEGYLLGPENIEKLSNEYAERITKAHLAPHKRQTEDTVFLNEFMDKEINSNAPSWIRKLPGFQQLKSITKKKVLKASIEKFKQFEPEYKEDPELRALYKEVILGKNPYQTNLIRGKDYFDPHILEDPDFQKAINPENNPETIANDAITIKTNPKAFFSLSPEKREIPEIYNAYIAARVNTPSIMSSINLIYEYPKLPAILQNNPDVQQKYKQMVLHMLRTAKMGHPKYLDCANIHPIAINDPEISKICQERNVRKASFYGWYKKLGQFA